MCASQIGKLRALAEERALSKAAKFLTSTGLANSQEPDVEQAPRDLHPSPLPHLVAGAGLPPSVPNNLVDPATDPEEQKSQCSSELGLP